jgi:hypothetical protein
MVRASTSLPVPVSPVSVIVTSARANGASNSKTRRMAGETLASLRAARVDVGAGGLVLPETTGGGGAELGDAG